MGGRTPLIADRFALIGNNVCADFVNTVYSPTQPDGLLRSAKDVVDFLLVTGALAPAQATLFRRELAAPEAADRFFALALELRSAVTDALHAIEARRAVDPQSLAALNALLAADAGFDRLEHRRGPAYEVTYERLRADPAANALVPIARETARLLTTPGVPLRKCAGPDCVRHFYDDSRTGKRRWCDMAICGNRAKASAFSERRRKSAD